MTPAYGMTIATSDNGRYRRRLQIMAANLKIGDWYEEDIWNNKESRYETFLRKVVAVYPFHVLFESPHGVRESFTYHDICQNMKRIKNQELMG